MDVDLTGVGRARQAEELAGALRTSVRSGTLRAGTRLPASRTLAGDLGVSRGVVVRAYELLVAEGYLLSRQGSGTTVATVAGTGDHPPVPPVRPTSNPGLPSGGTFPRAAWARCGARALAELTDADLGYGDPAGLPRLREELARYLGRVRSVLAPPERIIVVNGFAQASRLVADVLRASGSPRVAVEDPGSVGLRDQLAAGGVTCVPVPVDEGGVTVEAVAASPVRAVVVTPAHQFPTGAVMAPERRHALLRWARDHGGLIVEDDYDAEFRYDRKPVGALQGLGPDVVVYGGSVSKTLAPGLRLGWLVVPPDLLDTYRDAKYAADLACGVMDQATLAEFLARGDMDRHIRRRAVEYRHRRDALVAAVAAHLPGWHVAGTAAGLHGVLHPPAGDDEATAALAQACGLDARPLSGYCVDTRRQGLVVGYGHQSAAELARAVKALGTRVNRRPGVATSSGWRKDGTVNARAFRATVVPAGNATGVEVPVEVVDALGDGRRPKVTITVNGHSWRSRVASKGGRYLVGISAANRAAAGIAEGDEIEVMLELDTEPREVDEPPDLKDALDAVPAARAAFDRLAFGLRRKHVDDIEAAKSDQTRQRRIERLVESLR